MLSEDQVESIRRTAGRVAVIEWAGHELVFGRPSRADVREYRRKVDSPAEKPDALDQHAQVTLHAFDGEMDRIKARTAFGAFLDEFPGFTSNPRVQTALSVLMGIVEEEEAGALGKGVRLSSGPPRSTPTGSLTGSAASFAERSFPRMGERPQS